MRALNALRHWLVVAFSSVCLLALWAPSAATAALVGVRVTYIACIELTGDSQTRRDSEVA